MIDSGAVVKGALRGVRASLKSEGFKARNSLFYRTDDDNVLLVSVQKSVHSSAEESQLTVNYGVRSLRLARRLREDPSADLDIRRAHWRKRLSEGGKEKWLHVLARDTVEHATMIIASAVLQILPDLVAHSSNEALRDEWLSGASPGIGRIQCLLYASILLDEIGPREKTRAVVTELRQLVAGTIHERQIERELADAGIGERP